MSGGEQQMLAVARAQARDIKLLLLDEPYEGLAPTIVKEIEGIVEQIREVGGFVQQTGYTIRNGWTGWCE